MLREDIHMTEFLASHGMIARRRVMKTPPSLSGCKVVNDAGELDLGGVSLRFREARKNAESVKSYVIRDTRDDEAIARALFSFLLL